MNIQDLVPFKDQHGRLIYENKLGHENTLFGYIRKINCDHIVWQDNEKPDTFKIRNIISFDLVKLTNIKIWQQQKGGFV